MGKAGTTRGALRAARKARWLFALAAPFAAPLALAQESSSPGPRLESVEADSQAIKASDEAARVGVSWSPEDGFQIRTPDENFRLRVGLASAYRYDMVKLNGKTENGNAFFVLRPYLTGHVLRKWIQFWTSFEFAQNPPFLLDSFVELLPVAEIGLRAGQQPTPLSRHESFGPQQLLFPEWSPVADYFWTGHDKGATALGSLFAGKLDYWAGVYCGSPARQFVCAHGSWVLEGRLTVSPMGTMENSEAPYVTSRVPLPTRYSFTLQAVGGDYRDLKQTFNPAAFRFESEPSGERRKQGVGALDLWLQSERLTLFIEAYLRNTDTPQAPYPRFLSVGLWGQTGVMVWRRTLDLGVRVSWLDPNDHVDEDQAYTLEGQVAYYPFQTQMLVAKLRYGFSDQDGEEQLDGTELLTRPGKIHLLTVQLGLAI